MDSFL